MVSLETLLAAADYHQRKKNCPETFADIFVQAANFMEKNRLTEPKYRMNQKLKDNNYIRDIYTNPDGVLFWVDNYKEVKIIYHQYCVAKIGSQEHEGSWWWENIVDSSFAYKHKKKVEFVK